MAAAQQELSELLGLLAEELDLTDTEHANAETKYGNVSSHLKEPGTLLTPYSPYLYPQGSFALGTMVRPLIDGEEYDLDMACELQKPGDLTTPEAVYGAVGARLGHSYKPPMLEAKRRCWRIHYKGEFHMDIVPGIPAPGDRGLFNSRVYAVDRTKGVTIGGWAWRTSDPRGYANWFRQRMVIRFNEERAAIATRLRAKVDEIPDYKVKTPLQRAVQILKRHRDVSLKGMDCDSRPVSIIITTLAALAYDNEASLFDSLVKLVREMPRHIQDRNGVPWVPNPVNPQENFADKWAEKPQLRTIFLAWLRQVNADLDELLRQDRLDKINAVMGRVLGEKASNRAIANLGNRAKERREAGTLNMKTGVGAGLITAAAVGLPVKAHSFYGD